MSCCAQEQGSLILNRRMPGSLFSPAAGISVIYRALLSPS